MAEEFSSLLNETQCKLDILVRSMMQKVDKERERANRIGRQRDELLLWQSQAQERETNLTRQVSEQKERLRVLEQLVADEQARAKCSNDKHNRKSLKAHNKIKALVKKIESMEEASAATIPKEWHKVQLLRKQSDTITKSRIEIGDLRENLRVADMQVSQRETQVKELKQELECARKSSQEVEVISQQRLEELRDRFEAEHHSLRCELDEGQRKMQAKEQQLERLRGRSQSQREEHQKNNALLKAEICELQDTVNEMSQDLRQRQSEIETYSSILAKKDGKISELLQSIELLKAETATAQQEMKAQLSAAQIDAVTSREKLEIATHEVQDVRQELVSIQTSATTLLTRGGAAEVIRSIGDHLRQISDRTHKFCNPTHSQYHYVTNCGTFLCSECLQQALPEEGRDLTMALGSKDVFEIDCSWCRSDYWTWETLAIPYSRSWIAQFEALNNLIHQFESDCITT